MSSGGYRPGGGRPVGSKCGQTRLARMALEAAADAVRYPTGRRFATSLDFAMHVINDDGAQMTDRVRLAIAAMPFQHAKLAEQAAGKKEQAQQAAETAGAGSEWGNDLAQPETAARLN